MRRNLWRRSAVAVLVTGLALGGRAWAGSGGSHEEWRTEIAAAADAAFLQADADGDGKLSAAEFANFHMLMKQKLEALRFAKIDANGDGFITKDELAAAHQGHHHGHGPHGPGPDQGQGM